MANALTQTGIPRAKVMGATTGAAVGSALAVIAGWAIVSALESVGVTPPANVIAALGVVLTTIFTFAGGYYTPPGSDERVLTTAGGATVSARSVGSGMPIGDAKTIG